LLKAIANKTQDGISNLRKTVTGEEERYKLTNAQFEIQKKCPEFLSTKIESSE
jgi:hypothetical protein